MASAMGAHHQTSKNDASGFKQKGGAADILGVRQTTLYSRIRKFGITPAMWSSPAG